MMRPEPKFQPGDAVYMKGEGRWRRWQIQVTFWNPDAEHYFYDVYCAWYRNRYVHEQDLVADKDA